MNGFLDSKSIPNSSTRWSYTTLKLLIPGLTPSTPYMHPTISSSRTTSGSSSSPPFSFSFFPGFRGTTPPFARASSISVAVNAMCPINSGSIVSASGVSIHFASTCVIIVSAASTATPTSSTFHRAR